MGGWAIIVADVLVMPSLADVAGAATRSCSSARRAGDKWAVIAFGVALDRVMTWICCVGTELSARTQRVLIFVEVFALLLFAVVALVKVFGGDPPRLDRPVAVVVQPVRRVELSARWSAGC